MGTSAQFTLLDAAAATGEWTRWPGGQGVFRVNATWGGGTVKLQAKGPDGTEFDVGDDTTLTADGGGVFYLDSCDIRAHVATATAVTASAGGI
jgi:hypothetical protein